MQERLTEIETKLAYAEHLIDQLNDVVTDQEHRLTRLVDQVARLEEQVALHGVADPSFQKPPHY